MSSLRLALAASALLLAAPALGQSVGVTAAVNQSALGTQPNSVMRTIALGDNVIYNERIETNQAGLVQILLADGTTFTVGPNSALVIDSFVYDPNANTAQVAATLSKGVLRFIGGATSKTPDGVAIDTPVGTVGIRGGVTDINLTPSDGIPVHIDMIFGNEVTLSAGSTQIGRLYQAGYSLAFGEGGAPQVQKTPPAWSSQIQGALSGTPGSNGGAPGGPGDEEVAESEVAEENSGRSVEENLPPDPGPTPPTPDQLEAIVLATVIEQPIVVPPPQTRVLTGFSTGVVVIHNADGTISYVRNVPGTTTGGQSGDPAFTHVTVDGDGKPLQGVIDITSVTSNCFDCQLVFEHGPDGDLLSAIDITGTYETEAVGSIVSHTEVDLPEGTDYCECDFIEWGFWSVEGEVAFDDDSTATLSVDNGLWVAGDITTASQLADLGDSGDLATTVATYHGHAIGNVVPDITDPTAESYLASGQMDMAWSFAERQGVIAITDFDDHDFAGEISMEEGHITFSGELGGDGTGTVTGAFVNDGDDIAAGVIGDFSVFDGDWVATGIFVGEGGPVGTLP